MAAKTGKSNAGKGPLSYTEAIKQISAGEIRPLYLFYGEEGHLQERIIAKLRDDWLADQAPGAVSREDGRAMTQSQAVDLAGQMLLFSARKLVVIDEPAFIPCGKEQGRSSAGTRGTAEAEDRYEEEAKDTADPANTADAADLVEAGAAGKKQPGGKRSPQEPAQPLLAYLEQPASNSCLILRCRRGKPDGRNKLVAAIAGAGGLVETAILDAAGRTPFLQEALQKAGKQCPRAVLEQIARQPGGLSFCLRELDKVVAYAGEESAITAEMALAVLTPSLEANIFRMVDALGQRRRPAALRELRALLDSGESPFGIFAMMLRQFRLIFKAKACLQAGMGRVQIAQALGAQSFVAEKSAAQSKYYSFSELERAMELFCEKDLAMKSGAAPGQALEELVILLGS